MRHLLFILCLLLCSCTLGQPSPQDSTLVELPAFDEHEDIVRHVGYTASYNHTTLMPNWVAWELTAEEICDSNNLSFSFSRDPDVAYPKASREDYSCTGWDKGHMAPRADMKWSVKALEESYYFTNICPQDHSMNSGAWRKIEQLTRRLARRYGSVYIVCGPIMGEGRYGTIGDGETVIPVPDAFFKALAVWHEGKYHTVGFLMENNPQAGTPRSYAVSVDSVEAVIGRNLFPNLPEEAEQDFDWTFWKH